MLGVAISADLLTGAILGLALGLLLGPLLRSWLAWRDHAEAARGAREAALIEGVLERMDGRRLDPDGPERLAAPPATPQRVP